MWIAVFTAGDDLPYVIANKKLRHQVELAADVFVSRMTHPDVGPWWIDIAEISDAVQS